MSAADWHRCRRSFSSAFVTMRAKADGSSGFSTERSAGGRLRIRSKVTAVVPAWKG